MRWQEKVSKETEGIIITVIISLLVGVVIILFTSKSPLEALYSFFLSPLTSNYNIATLLNYAVPLILAGLALSVAFQAKVWNLAAEGQVYLGAFLGIVIGLQISEFPPVFAIIIILSFSFIVGGVVGLIPAFLKNVWDVNELISSFMISLIVLPIVNYFLSGPMKMAGVGINATPYVNKSFVLPQIFSKFNLNISFILSLIIVGVIYFFLYQTATGTFLRIYGYNREFANYGGINTKKYIIISMIISGGLCGLAGITSSLGIFHGRMIEFSTYGMGWDGIAVALVARLNPVAVVPVAILFSYLITGANLSGLLSDIPPEVATVIISIIYFLVTAQDVNRLIPFKRRRDVK